MLTEHIGFFTRSTVFLTRHAAGSGCLRHPYAARLRIFCEYAGNMLTRRALYNDRVSIVTTCRSMCSFPQWHGLTQAHFPPRPHKTAWHSDITNVIWPHGVPQTRHNNAPPSFMDSAKSPRASPLWTSFCVGVEYMSRAEAFLKCIFSGHCWQKALGLGAMWATTHRRA